MNLSTIAINYVSGLSRCSKQQHFGGFFQAFYNIAVLADIYYTFMCIIIWCQINHPAPVNDNLNVI